MRGKLRSPHRVPTAEIAPAAMRSSSPVNRLCVPEQSSALRLQRGRDLRAFFDRAVEFGCGERSSRLLVRVAKREQSRLGPFRADEAETDGQAFYQCHWNSEVRIAGDRRK